MSEKIQFDEFLGGTERLPRDAQIMKLAAARASEMSAMTYSIENPQHTKLIFQKLPVHMRRRIMSHNAKRMPRKLRNSHISQMTKSGLPPKTKRPSRKYRRQALNLLLEYNRRQRSRFWLETHIWHAKRFKMIEKWGFKLPSHSNDKCFKANYRAIMSHCLLQDISYYTCIEIKGPLDILIQKLNMHCNLNELTFGAKIYLNGKREGTVMFYKKNSYPFHPIGKVDFLWNNSTSNDIKAIWIWVHPAFYSEVLQEIISNFNFKLTENTNNLNQDNNKIDEQINNQRTEQIPADMKIFLNMKIPIYKNTNKCELIILRNCVNRFRLCGPLALNVLTSALKLPNVSTKKSEIDLNVICTEIEKEKSYAIDINNEDSLQMEIDTIDKINSTIDTWFKSYYQSQDNIEAFKIQKEIYNKLNCLKSPNQLPPNMVLALTVLDPRFFFPKKRTKSVSTTQISEITPIPPTLANKSPLWLSNIRNYVTKNCISTVAINKLRSQNLVPGINNDQFYNEDIMHKIPIMLIQKPGGYENNNSIGFGCGIDIIFPAGWSMPFWLAFVLRCAKPGGLRESMLIAYENSNINLPTMRHHPDTKSYIVEANYERMKLTEKYFKLPPNKRVNYVKFGITSPFFCEWNLLMKEWHDVDNFYILRDHKILTILKENMNPSLKRKRKSMYSEENQNLDDLIKFKNCFVPVKITIERRGLPKNFSVICIPTKEDLIKYVQDKKWSGPMESVKRDYNEEKRKTLRRGHLALLKRLRKQRVRAKTKMENACYSMSVKNVSEITHLRKIRKVIKKKLLNSNQTLIDQQAQTMKNLYLPKCYSVRHSCDRDIIGYVTQGGFSFSKAIGVGLGYVILSSVLNLIQKNSNIVLSRNTTTRKYRICTLEILN